MTTTFKEPTAGPTPPPKDDSFAHKAFYVTRFEYRRPPGISATGIATVPKEAVGDWDLAVFYTLDFHIDRVASVSGFILNSKKPAERQVIIEAINKSAQFLVFTSGELAEVDVRDKQPLQLMMRLSSPMFDENAILHAVRSLVLPPPLV
jgi:hypothetical protein